MKASAKVFLVVISRGDPELLGIKTANKRRSVFFCLNAPMGFADNTAWPAAAWQSLAARLEKLERESRKENGKHV